MEKNDDGEINQKKGRKNEEEGSVKSSGTRVGLGRGLGGVQESEGGCWRAGDFNVILNDPVLL